MQPSLQLGMAGRECYHCRQWIEDGEAHDYWTTTEAALTQDLSGDLRDAWERLRETAVAFGDQRIYASHQSIMFSQKSCYFFVRPKKNFLEVCVFLGRALKAPHVRRVVQASKSKLVHLIQIRHRDEVEPPITDWLREAYERTSCLTRWPEKSKEGVSRRSRNPDQRRSSRQPPCRRPAPPESQRDGNPEAAGRAEREDAVSETNKATVTGRGSLRAYADYGFASDTSHVAAVTLRSVGRGTSGCKP